MNSPAFPTVTLKIATSLDGRIATASGESQWITCAESRAEVHRLRAAHDAVLVGAETALKDNPRLTARTDPPPNRQPVRIVADSSLRTPLESHLVTTARQVSTVLAVGLDVEEERERPYLAMGVQVWALPIAPMGGLSVRGLMSYCADEGIGSILLEGGGRLAASFLKAGMVDVIEWFRAPVLLGGDGVPCVAGLGLSALSDAPRFTRETVREIGADVWETYRRIDANME